MRKNLDDVVYDYEWYRSLLRMLDEAGYTFHSFAQPPENSVVYLRHDVDWSPKKALRMAKIEAEIGISSTYFFLVTASFYNALSAPNRQVIRKISSLGHEIGLHFAVREYFDDDPGTEQLRERIRADQSVLKTILDDVTQVVAFHNPPEWVLNRCFEGFTSTYEPRFFEDITYTSDSLQRWREEPPFVDHDRLPSEVQILVHPTLWGEQQLDARKQIQAAQQDIIHQTDEEMEMASRLDW